MKKTTERFKGRILVGTNSLTESQYPAYTNHCQFWFRLGRSYPEVDFIFWNPSRMSIDRMRNTAAKAALECEADYLLWLDDDVIVNPNYALQQLLDCNADCAAGKVVIRGYPFDYMVFKRNEAGGLQAVKKLPTKGIYPCDAVGFSFCLIKTDIFKRLTPPWFVTGLNNTEDIYFCVKARQIDPKYSIKVNCSCDCGHILWPEIMDSSNRLAYAKYFKEIGQVPPDEESLVWRGRQYLNRVKEIAHVANKT